MTAEQRHSYDNLILLCRNHHQLADDNPEVFTIDVLKDIRAKHEARIEESTSTKPKEGFVDDVMLELIEDGTQLAHLAFDAQAYLLDHDHPTSNEAQVAIGALLQDIRDWGDISSDVGPAGRVDAGMNLHGQLETLRSLGYCVVAGIGRWRHSSGLVMSTAIVNVVGRDKLDDYYGEGGT